MRLQSRIHSLEELHLELLDDEQLRRLHLALSDSWHDLTNIYRRTDRQVDQAERDAERGR
jgi:hypothetical protein